MSAKRNQVGIRLVALNGKAVERELKKFGAEGHAALDRIQKASRPARAGLKAVDSGVGELKTRMTGLANSAGPVGTALMALGPAGTAAAVGIGALTLAFGKALAISRDAVREFDALAKRARTLGLSTDLFQALQLAAEEQGIAQESLNVALQTFATRSGEAANATGTLYSRLKQINPELLAQFQAAATGEERLKLLAGAVQDLDSAEERAALTAAAFGQRNVDLVRILADTGESIDDLIRRAKDLGVVVEEQMLKRAEEMENQFGVAARVIDLNLKQAFVDLAPVLISTLELFAQLAKGARVISDIFRDLENKSTGALELQAAELVNERVRREQEIARLQSLPDNARNRAQIARVRRESERLMAEALAVRKILDERAGYSPDFNFNADQVRDDTATAEDRAKAAAWRERLLTIDEKRAQVMEEIDRLETSGALTSSEAAMARMKAEADLQKLIDKGRKTKSASDKEAEAMLREVTRLLDAARTPAEDLEKRLARIADLQAGGTFDEAASGQGAEMAKRARVIAMREYLAAAEDTEEALRRIEDIAANGFGANRVAAEIALAERAGKSFGETMQKVSDGISDSLTDAIFEAKNLGDALQTLARQIARDFVNAQFRRMLGGGGGSGGIFGAIGSFVSGLFGGGVTAAIRHDGGPVGGAGPTRRVSASVFDGASRRHDGGGLRPGERPVIALEDEYVMTRAMQGDLVNTLRGMGALASSRAAVSPAPVVNVITPPGHTAETRESRSASGAMQIDVIVKPLERALAKNMREGGPLRDAIGGTFGLNRANGLT